MLRRLPVVVVISVPGPGTDEVVARITPDCQFVRLPLWNLGVFDGLNSRARRASDCDGRVIALQPDDRLLCFAAQPFCRLVVIGSHWALSRRVKAGTPAEQAGRHWGARTSVIRLNDFSKSTQLS